MPTPGGELAPGGTATRSPTSGLIVVELAAGKVAYTEDAVSGDSAAAPSRAPAASFDRSAAHEIFDDDWAFDSVSSGEAPSLMSDHGELNGVRIATDATNPTDVTASGDSVTDSTDSSDEGPGESTGETTPSEDTGTAGKEFSGSAVPAGPDLTATEEAGVIADGWK